ncbi:uncharacterized protein SCDLUD_003797 [Saccharomycodes ludwigii]|uniref:uncharacterized protein n=1 Tax=Saccharomycodes ludwigii TaxID=36035 RepID=UPI001E84F15E|nr:hypothetical protein SCDLUD_003797 [Saccharomycodes ludwigii]KAH3900791.1 hypothetical protein SCDLUD_003797 [Saccharomycodes ludwigii]
MKASLIQHVSCPEKKYMIEMSQNNVTQSKKDYETLQDIDATNEGVSETTIAITNASTAPLNDLEETIVDNSVNNTDTIHTTAITSTALVSSNRGKKKYH